MRRRGTRAERARHALAQGDLEGALRRVRHLARKAFEAGPVAKADGLWLAEADRVCREIGEAALARGDVRPAALPPPSAEPVPTDVYVATEIYHVGGHTAVIGDFVRASPERRSLLLLTDIDERQRAADPRSRRLTGLPGDAVRTCPEPSLRGKLTWLLDVLHRERPERVFLFHHSHDCVALAAALPRLAAQIVFVHHVDRHACLGVSSEAATHVDLTPFTHRACQQLGVRAPHYLPLTAPDAGARRPPLPIAARQPLTTASSGSEWKFEPRYRFAYPDVVARLLAATGGRHVHIGHLSEHYLDRLRRALHRRGVPEANLSHVPWVPSLWRALPEHGVDLYLNSFPHGGARAAVEVMGSGTPAVWHSRSARTRFRDTHMKYPEAAVWRTPAELRALVQGIDRTWLTGQARYGRRHYESVHHPDAPGRALFFGAPSTSGAFTRGALT